MGFLGDFDCLLMSGAYELVAVCGEGFLEEHRTCFCFVGFKGLVLTSRNCDACNFTDMKSFVTYTIQEKFTVCVRARNYRDISRELSSFSRCSKV